MKNKKVIFTLAFFILISAISFLGLEKAGSKNTVVTKKQDTETDEHKFIEAASVSLSEKTEKIAETPSDNASNKEKGNENTSEGTGKGQSKAQSIAANSITHNNESNIGTEYALSPEIKELYPGEQQLFSVYSHKTGETDMALPFKWTVEGDTGKITESNNNKAYFIADKPGTCNVVASYNGKKYIAKVNVKIKTCQVNITVQGNGKVIKYPNKSAYEYGETVTLTAVPDSGYGLFSWVFQKPFHSEKGEQIQIKFEENTDIIVNFSHVVSFSDKIFESKIRKIIDKPTGQIVAHDVHTINSLDLEGSNITNLEGLQYFLSLEGMNLRNNNINYVPNLSSLKLLSTADLSNNKIENLSSLANLKSIKFLYLNRNKIRDISPLKNLSTLEALHLGGNEITDYSPVSGYYSKLKSKDFAIP
ncbi:leucine Rich repeat-containing domain protein [Clostridiales bacterium oral taxon 876 str. F0540]|nr:leucine Rich repeat-containing domain protein [Clostridiales bacterium oral taxon 876 str. F0540]